MDKHKRQKELNKLRHLLLSDFKAFCDFFFRVKNGREMLWAPYLKEMCDTLQDTRYQLVVVNCPPVHGKSEICSVMYPAWVWANDPSIRAFTVSHTEKLAVHLMQYCKDLIETKEYKILFPHVKFHESANQKSHYKTTKKGERKAVTPGGKVTGFHAHLIIVDDPIDASKATKHHDITNFTNWYNNVLLSRRLATPSAVCESGGKMVIVMQRLSYTDISGQLIAKHKRDKTFKHLKFPIVDKDGIPLHPQLWPASRIKKEIFETWAHNKELLNAQYYQEPSPDEKKIFDEAWFKVDQTKLVHLNPTELFIGIDPASAVGPRNDPTAFVVCLLEGKKIYVVDSLNAKINFQQQKAELRNMAQKWSDIFPHLEVQVIIESKSNGLALLDIASDALEGINHSVQGCTPIASKEKRLSQTQWIFKDELVKFLQTMPPHHYTEIVDQILNFGQTQHDDLMDALVMILLWNSSNRRFTGKTDADRILEGINFGRTMF
jgi:predicted phage terminase large subunit-like protein